MSVRIAKNGPITTVILHRPEVRNAVDAPTAQELAAAFRAFDADPDARVAVLYGEGGTFCAGADLKAISEGRLPRLVPDGDAPMGPSRMVLGKPVIAAISGHAVAGGLELALWCDLRVVEEDAVLGVFCRRWGVPLTGRPVPSHEALAMGLVNRVVPRGQAREAAEALAREVAAFPQGCMNADRLSAYEQAGQGLEEALRQEFERGIRVLESESIGGATRFARGAGRHGKFE
jgi:enoyl-CoA hydratase